MISRSRSRFLWLLLTLWALAALGRAAWFAGPAREEKMARTEKIAGRVGVIPATRGTIFDRDHRAAAWDDGRLELVISGPWSEENEARLSSVLKRSVSPDESGVIVYRLRADEAEALEALLRSGFPARIVLRRERVFAVSGGRREFLEHLENLYDRKLRGRDIRRIRVRLAQCHEPGADRLRLLL